MTIDPRALQPGRFVQSEDPSIVAFARQAAEGATDPRSAAIQIYYAVRDRVIYNPYVRFCRPECYSAKDVLEKGNGFCIPKAALLTACLRAEGIPARLGFADVKNHLATRKLLTANGDDLFRWHAYTEVWLDERWIKATPAFNLALCEKFGVHPLEWDGYTDSVFHAYDKQDRKHMEYVNQHGTFYDVPFEEITATLRKFSPGLMLDDPWSEDANFAAEANQ